MTGLKRSRSFNAPYLCNAAFIHQMEDFSQGWGIFLLLLCCLQLGIQRISPCQSILKLGLCRRRGISFSKTFMCFRMILPIVMKPMGLGGGCKQNAIPLLFKATYINSRKLSYSQMWYWRWSHNVIMLALGGYICFFRDKKWHPNQAEQKRVKLSKKDKPFQRIFKSESICLQKCLQKFSTL